MDNIVIIRHHHHHRRHQNQHHHQGGEVVVVVVVDNIVTIHSRQLGVAAHLDGMSSPFPKNKIVF